MIILGCLATSMLQAQELSGQYTTEWQWDMNKNTNWVNQLRLDLSIPLGSDRNTIEAATLHLAKTGESVIGDWQGFSNIDADNMLAAIAVLGFMHQWNSGHLFIGVRNVNEDFFTSPITALFTNSSCGIFPTVAASYPIANYPFSGLTLYFDITKKGWTFRNSLYNGSGYNGWTAHDNPFLIKPKTDGIFNMSQIEYTHRSGEYYAGIAVHTRQQPFVTEDETASTMTQTNGTSVNGTTTDENTPNKTSTDENSLARNHLCLVALWRAEVVDIGRKESLVHGAIFREFKPQERLLPLCRDRRRLSGREERVRRVGTIRPIPARR